MFDNLRDQSKSSPFYEEEAKFQQAAGTLAPPVPDSSNRLLGMTGPQRFVLSVMLMIMVCIMGAMALLITGKLVIY
jgi:hypothetical protein